MQPNVFENRFSVPGYRLVPWESWEQWNFVYEALFSPSSESIFVALNRIIAWQSRGCLPVSVEITAAIKDIHQRDPFFKDGILPEHVVSEEILRMAYSMAIMRLVNGVVDQSQRTPTQSISDFAETIGLPRLLVDIRHESAHNHLPALPLLQLASKQALNWLKSHYWEPQKNMFCNYRLEIKFRLYTSALHAKQKLAMRATNEAAAVSSNDTGLRKQWKSNLRTLVHFCTIAPSEVVSVLLEECLLNENNLQHKFEAVLSDSSQENIVVDDLEEVQFNSENWKSVIDTICLKKPEMLPVLLKAIFERITAIESIKFEQGKLGFLDNLKVPSEMEQFRGIEQPHTQQLVFWATWVLKDLEMFKKAGQDAHKSTKAYASFWEGPVPKALLEDLLWKCLKSLAHGSTLAEVAMMIAKLIGSKSLITKIEYLIKLSKQDQKMQNCVENCLDEQSTLNAGGQKLMGNNETCETNGSKIFLVEKDIEPWNAMECESLGYGHDDVQFRQAFASKNASLEKAKQQFWSLKRIRIENIDHAVSEKRLCERESNGEFSANEGMWSIAKHWKPCSIGMLPSDLHSIGVLPVLERAASKLESDEVLVSDENQPLICVQCKQAYQGPECPCPKVTLDVRMEQNKPICSEQNCERGARFHEVVECDEKYASEGRESEYRNSTQSYSAAPEQQNVKNLRKDQQKNIVTGDKPIGAHSSKNCFSNSAMEGHLLMDGVLKPCGSEEIKAIQSAVRIYESFQN